MELAEKDFQVEVLTILSGIKENMLITNEKRKPLSKKIENIEKEPNGKC